MTRKRLLPLGLVLAAVLAGGLLIWNAHRPVTLHVGFWAGSHWGVPTADSYAVLDAAIEKFEASHPGVRVEYVSGLLERDYTEWIMAQMLKGKMPDVMLIPPDDFDEIASIGALEDLQGKSFALRDRFYPGALSAGQWEGRQYALPYECVPTLMFVNKTLLEREGIALPEDQWSMEDFYAICRQVTRDTDGDNVIDQFGCCNYTWEEALFASGASLFQNDGHFCDLTSDEMLQAVSLVAGLNAIWEEHTVTAREFEAGQVAFRPMLFTEYRAYQSYPWRIKKYSRFAWDCLKMPASVSGGNISEMTSLQLGISSQSHHKKLAWELLQTLTCDEEIQEKIYTNSQGCSPLRAVTAAPETAEILQRTTLSDGRLDLKMLDEVLASAVTVPRFQNYSQIMEMVDTRVAEAVMSPDNLRLILTSAQVEINRFLKN